MVTTEKPKVKQKITFEVVDEDGNKLTLAVKRPDQEAVAEAQKSWNKTFREAIDAKAFVRTRLDHVAREQNVWSDELQRKYDNLQEEIKELRKSLMAGTAEDEVATAWKIKELIRESNGLIADKNSLDIYTAEGQADAVRFNRLVSLCTVYDDSGKRYYTGYEDFINKQEKVVAGEASVKLAQLLYNIDVSKEAKLPENRVLRARNLVDEKFRRINEDGHLVTEDGKLINEDGRLVDKEGYLIDKYNNRIDKDGNFIFDDYDPSSAEAKQE